MRTTTLILALALLTSCCKHYVPPVTPITPKDDNCAGACSHLVDLGCPEGEPLEDGTSCTEFCEATQSSGHALRPTCIISLKSCDPAEMEKCQGPREVFDD
jgi:hypothetical protein